MSGRMNATESLWQFRPEDVPVGVRDAANEILNLTIPTEAGRTFPTREEFGRCLMLLAALTDNPKWGFLRGD